ncbi:unnamed protein product, partial [Timema podura]|nr:unnamed protein product [Timema podura]
MDSAETTELFPQSNRSTASTSSIDGLGDSVHPGGCCKWNNLIAAALFNSGRQFCGGSLIDSTHILTAAHCVAHMSSWDVSRVTVRLGDHNIKTNSEVRHIEKKVKRVVRHRGFDSRTL